MTTGLVEHRKKAQVYTLTPRPDKIVEAVLVILNEAKRRNATVTQYDIVKTLFIADRSHLNAWGRPITFDNYVAMEHGPVPSLAYNILKEDARSLADFRVRPLWTRRIADGRKFVFENPEREADEDILSPSDIGALKDALGTVASLSFGQVRRLTHQDQAYIDAWEDQSDRKQFPMSYALLFETPDHEAAESLAFLSKHV